MSIKFFFIILLLSLATCKSNHSDIEICFENVQNRIGSDSILNKIRSSPIDSYGDFAALINRVIIEESKSDSTCTTALDKFLLENDNSITVNNLIFFQQFQAYLKHEKFDKSKARDIALKFEEKWK